MMHSDLYARVSTIEDELLAIEATIPFGKDPDASIVANLHTNVAAYLPRLIGRTEGALTPEGDQITREYYDSFEKTILRMHEKFTVNKTYIEIIANIRSIYEDILAVYKQG